MKPCPFCGGEAVMLQWARSPQDVSMSWIPGESNASIRCKTCTATITHSLSSGSSDPTESHKQTVAEEVLRLWERRQ
jgi:hypothetical protein